MPSGSMDGGWNKIARDLDRALSLADLGKNGALLAQLAREGCYTMPEIGPERGSKEPAPCIIDIALVAERTGRNRTALCRDLTALVEANILRRFEDGSILINKDYRSWTFPSAGSKPARPRFTPGEIALIDEALAIKKKGFNPLVRPVTIGVNERCAGATAGEPPVAPAQRVSCAGAKDRCAGATTMPGAIEERTRVLNLEPKERSSSSGRFASQVRIEDGGQPPASPAPAEPKMPDGLTIRGSGSTEAKALEAKVGALLGKTVGALARFQCDRVPVEWVDAIVQNRFFGRDDLTERAILGSLPRAVQDCINAGRCEHLETRPTVPFTAKPQAAANYHQPDPEEWAIVMAQLERSRAPLNIARTGS